MLINLKGTFICIAIWSCVFILKEPLNLLDLLSSKGVSNLGVAYYRLFTGALLHVNIIHLLANVVTMFWVGYFLERSLGSIKMILFILCATFIANLIFSFIYKAATSVIGGSVCVFTCIGLIIALQLFKPDFPRFHLGTWYGNWILVYSIVGNFPVMSFMDYTTVTIHIIALVTGILLGSGSILLNLL